MIVDRYYYNQLNKNEQIIYRCFYKGIMDRKDIIPIPVKGRMTQEVFNRIFEAMTRDNPLIYYLNQSTCSLATDVLGHTAICPQYFFSRERIHEYNRKIEKAVNELAADLKLKEGTEYEKELKVHDWLCNFVSYDYDGADINDPVRFMEAHNIVGVFAHHRAQCEGIAKAVKVLLNAVDIKCIVVTGKVDGNGQNGPHAWNIVNIDGKAYQLDITWDIGAGGKNKDRMAYDYFNLTDGMMYMDHTPDSKLPICNSLDMNYFRNNKLVFNSKTRLLAYIDSLLKKGEMDFYFQLEGRLKMKDILKDISDLSMSVMTTKGKRNVRIQHIPNEKLGICWVRIK